MSNTGMGRSFSHAMPEGNNPAIMTRNQDKILKQINEI